MLSLKCSDDKRFFFFLISSLRTSFLFLSKYKMPPLKQFNNNNIYNN